MKNWLFLVVVVSLLFGALWLGWELGHRRGRLDAHLSRATLDLRVLSRRLTDLRGGEPQSVIEEMEWDLDRAFEGLRTQLGRHAVDPRPRDAPVVGRRYLRPLALYRKRFPYDGDDADLARQYACVADADFSLEEAAFERALIRCFWPNPR